MLPRFIRLLSTFLVASALMASPAFARDYLLRTGDSLNVSVVGHPELMVPAQPVRPDGCISLPMIDPVRAAGRSVADVTAAVQEAYRSILTNPRVLVSIAQLRPIRVTVLGKVHHAGSFDFAQPPTLLEAIATAGGLNRRAARNAITLVDPENQMRQTYDLDQLLQGQASIPVLPEGSVVEVGEVWGPDIEVWLPLLTSLITAVAFVKTWN